MLIYIVYVVWNGVNDRYVGTTPFKSYALQSIRIQEVFDVAI